ncbi:MAG: ParA family protein [Deltaproteobacteria bacterium]|nr:ParA family protein [Deltaproteobacteria bacterium]
MNIALISRKGSVARTTTAVNMGAALAAAGKRVLLIDLDAQGAASRSLGVERGQLAPSMADVLLSHLPLEKAIRTTGVEGLDLVTGSADLSAVESTLAPVRHREQCLRRPLEEIQSPYDVVLLDSPSGLALLATAALVASDAHLVALTPQFLVLDGLQNFLDGVERLRYRLGSRSRRLGMLLTQVDYRTKTTRPYVTDLKQAHGDEVFETEIRINVRLAEAPSFGQTIYQYAPESTGATAYTKLAEEVLARYQVRSQGEEPRCAPRPVFQRNRSGARRRLSQTAKAAGRT